MEWRRLCDELAKPTKDRLQALESLLDYMDHTALDARQKGELVDLSTDLLSDNNRKVAQLTLEALAKMVIQNPDGLKTYFKFMVHHAADKLADTNQLVRQASCNVLLALAAAFSADAVRERVSRWFTHKSWRARHGVVQLFAETVERHGFDRTETNINYVETSLRLLEDPDNTVRDATAEFLQEVYKQWGEPLWAQCQNSLRHAQLLLLYTKLVEAGLVLPEDALPLPDDSADTDQLGGMLGKGQHVANGQDDYRGAPDQMRPAGAGRRGGFKDGGGVTANGSLPEADPVPIHSERELREELEALPARLALAVQWGQRVEALVRLEGVQKGCPPALHEALVDGLKPLRDVLTQQVNDRRSAVSRQACHLLCGLASTLGVLFEPLAVHFFPTLLRVAIITVQVIAEAAELCARVILQQCESARLLPIIAETLQKERNTKIRMLCSLCLLMVLELWHPETFLRSVDAIEAAMAKALMDSAPETRRNARDAYGAYVHSCPEQAAAFYKRVDRDLQDKMDDATRAYIMGERLSSGSWSSQSSVSGRGPGSLAGASTSSRTSSLCRTVSTGEAPSFPSRGPSRQSSLGPASAASTRDGAYFRKASAHHQMDELADSVDSLMIAGPTAGGGKANGSSAAAARKPRLSVSRGAGEGQTPRMQATRLPSAGGGAGAAAAAAAPAPQYAEYGGQPKPVSVTKVVNSLLAEGKSWSEKVEALAALRDVLKGNLYGDPGELGRELERAQVRLIECAEDAHFRVVQAGLEALAAALATAPRLFEPMLDRIMQVLFSKTIDAKEVIRAAAKDTLDVCAKKCSADAIMPGVVRALEVMKVPKSRIAVMEFAAASIGTHASAGPPSSSMHLKQWVAKLIPMLSDKNGEVRRVAVRALQSVYVNVDPAVIHSALASANGAHAIAMKRALQPVAPDLEAQQHPSPAAPRTSASAADVQVYIAAARRPSSVPGPAASATQDDTAAGLGTPRSSGHHQHLSDPPSSSPRLAAPSPRLAPGSSPRLAAPDRPLQLPANPPPPASTPSRPRSPPPASTPAPPAAYSTPLTSWQPRLAPGAYPQTPLGTLALPPATPEDPSVQSRHLLRLLKQLHSQLQQDAPDAHAVEQLLTELLDAVRSVPDAVWEGRMDADGSHLQALLRCCAPLADEAHAEGNRELAARVLRDMARHHPGLAHPLLKSFIATLLAFADCSEEVFMTVNEGLDAVAATAPPAACLDTLLTWLPVDGLVGRAPGEANPQTSVIKAIQKVVQRMPAAELGAKLQPRLLPGLFTAINHELTVVRKAAVFCLVEMWAALGEALTPHLEGLNMTQRKLLTFYFTRRQEQAGGGK